MIIEESLFFFLQWHVFLIFRIPCSFALLLLAAVTKSHRLGDLQATAIYSSKIGEHTRAKSQTTVPAVAVSGEGLLRHRCLASHCQHAGWKGHGDPLLALLVRFPFMPS